MRDNLFHSPVSIRDGVGKKHEIASIDEMHAFLADWPAERHCDVYRTALRACHAARAGHLTAEQARRAFVAFAGISRILARDADMMIAGVAMGKFPEKHA